LANLVTGDATTYLLKEGVTHQVGVSTDTSDEASDGVALMDGAWQKSGT
jgi:hypothetical protein